MFLKFLFGLGGHHRAFFVMKNFCCLADFEHLPIQIINVIYCIQIFLTPNVRPRKVRVLYVGIQALMGCSVLSRFSILFDVCHAFVVLETPLPFVAVLFLDSL